jgi:hypothetical protein
MAPAAGLAKSTVVSIASADIMADNCFWAGYVLDAIICGSEVNGPNKSP